MDLRRRKGMLEGATADTCIAIDASDPVLRSVRDRQLPEAEASGGNVAVSLSRVHSAVGRVRMAHSQLCQSLLGQVEGPVAGAV